MAMATRNAAGIAMPNPQSSLALKQAAKKLQAEHQLSQANQLLDESVLWRQHQERILAQMLETPFLSEPARELDLLDEEE